MTTSQPFAASVTAARSVTSPRRYSTGRVAIFDAPATDLSRTLTLAPCSSTSRSAMRLPRKPPAPVTSIVAPRHTGEVVILPLLPPGLGYLLTHSAAGGNELDIPPPVRCIRHSLFRSHIV